MEGIIKRAGAYNIYVLYIYTNNQYYIYIC
eukprot:COSAG06_NODE_31331_length_523_cov_0.959906_1_plen_29_part_10